MTCLRNNTAQLYFILGRANLRWKLCSIPKDGSDIDRFSNRKWVLTMCHHVARQQSDGDQLVVAGLGQLVMGVTFIPLFNGRAPLVATEREVLALFCTPTP